MYVCSIILYNLLVSDGFDKKTVANLILTNTSQRRVGFKMKSTAPEYYGADPAFGIVEPNTKYTISGEDTWQM